MEEGDEWGFTPTLLFISLNSKLETRNSKLETRNSELEELCHENR